MKETLICCFCGGNLRKEYFFCPYCGMSSRDVIYDEIEVPFVQGRVFDRLQQMELSLENLELEITRFLSAKAS